MKTQLNGPHPSSPDWKQGYKPHTHGLECERCGSLVASDPAAAKAHTDHHAKIDQLLTS